MIRLATCSILYSMLAASQLIVRAAVIPTISPIVPTPFPFSPATNSLIPGYTNPYYNQYKGAAVPILSYSSEHAGDGTYAFSFSTADGKQAQENGFLKGAYIDNAREPQGTQVVQGNYAYISPEGIPIQVSYVANENGFRPSGVHIPANGKAVIPHIGDIKDKQILEPYNRYNPYNYRNRLFGQNNNRSYDPRYYDPTKYNPYYNNQYLAPRLTNVAKHEVKKRSA